MANQPLGNLLEGSQVRFEDRLLTAVRDLASLPVKVFHLSFEDLAVIECSPEENCSSLQDCISNWTIISRGQERLKAGREAEEFILGLLTAVFDYYELASPPDGIGGGFRYRTVPCARPRCRTDLSTYSKQYLRPVDLGIPASRNLAKNHDSPHVSLRSLTSVKNLDLDQN
jgi:hypothetical protein